MYDVMHYKLRGVSVMVMVFSATFNKTSVISWRSVLLVEETGVPGENHRPVSSHWHTMVYRYQVHLAWAIFELTTLVVIDTDCIGSCISNLSYNHDHNGPFWSMWAWFSSILRCILYSYLLQIWGSLLVFWLPLTHKTLGYWIWYCFHAWYCSIGKDELFNKHTWSSHLLFLPRDRRGRDRMIVGFPTTYAISGYHHWCFDFEARSGRGVQQDVIKSVSDLRQVGGFLWVLRLTPPIKLTAMI